MYKQMRNKAGYSIENAAFRLHIAPRTLAKYEAEDKAPPEVVLAMAELYNTPHLLHWQCKNNCPIGELLGHEVTKKSLTTAVIQFISALNSISAKANELVEIAEDEQITEDEYGRVAEIRPRLSRLEHCILEMKACIDEVLGLKNTQPLIAKG